jgi:hypothetical protein
MDETPASPANPTAVGDVSAFTIDLTKERVPVTAFQDTNIVRVVGLPDFSGTLTWFYNSSSVGRLMAVILGDAVPLLRLVPDTDEAGFYWQGLANLDGSVSVSATGAVSGTAKWDAADNWTFEEAS